MHRLLPMFPAGRAGVGLVLLRLAAVAALSVATQSEFGRGLHGHAALACGALAVLLSLGLTTVLCAAVCCIGELGLLLATGGPPPHSIALAALVSVSIVLLGPGAYSIDARWFGRRVVVFRDPKDRRED